MRRLLIVVSLLLSSTAFAQERKAVKDQDLKKDSAGGPDKSLAGDITRKAADKTEAAPALQYDQYRLSVELQVREKRLQQIADLEKLLELTPSNDPRGKKERPRILFRLGELYWEESKYFFFEANRKDDDLIQCMNRKDQACQERAKAEKQELLAKSKDEANKAVAKYSEIVQNHKDFERSDEVLYFLGHNLMEAGEDRKALVAFKRLIEKHPNSKFIYDAHLAFGEYYFNNSKGKRDMLEKALASYKLAAGDPANTVYGFALYKQGWCYFNLADYAQAMDKFRAVVLYASIQGKEAVEGGPKGGRAGLVREARNDFVRAFERSGGSPTDARSEFAKIADKPDDRFDLMKKLAGLYYENGKDKEAALTYNMLLKEKPLSPEAPGWQGRIVDCVLRAGNKRMTVEQVRRLVKVANDVKKSGVIKDEKSKKALEEANELSERTISNLAVNWHNEARKTRDDETFQFANEVYGDYLTLFPDNPKAYDLRFFWAELLHDNLQKYDKAAEQYSIVFGRDISCIEKGARPEQAKKAKKGAKKEEEEEKPEEAGDEKKETKASAHKCPGKWMVNAAYNAILSYDEVVKKAEEQGKFKAAANTDISKKLPIPAEKQALLDACERYIKYIPEGEKRVEIIFKAAKIYYDHNYLEEAVARFSDIALNYPDYKFENGDRAAEVAANLVLDSYNLMQDWAKVNEWARKFYANERLATGKFRDDLAKLIEQSAFKLVNQLEARKEYVKAAEAYLGFVQEFPNSDLADQALFNASIDFFNGKALDKAIETRKRILQQYPKSKFVPQVMYALAEGHEAIADFENASEYYEAYCSRFEKSRGISPAPKKGGKKGKAARKAEPPRKEGDLQVWEEAKAQIACFNAGVFRDGLGQYKQALRDRERYLSLWPDHKDSEAVFLSIADLHEKNGKYQAAMKQLEEYERKYKQPNKLLCAEGRIASIYEDKLKNSRAARKIYDRIWKLYEQLGRKQRESLETCALDAVGRAHFVISEDEWKKYTSLRLRWSKLANINEFKQSMNDKAKALQGIQKLYTTTVGFKSADPAICALHKIGLAYDHFYNALLDPPVPKGMPEDLLAAFKAELETQAEPVKQKASEAFSSAVLKSQELSVFNECTTASFQKLREKYNPQQFPPMNDETLEVKGDFKFQSVGGDVLASVQPIPIVSAARAKELKEKSKEIKGDIEELDRKSPAPPPDDDLGGPKVAPVSSKSKDVEPEDEPL